MKPGGVLAKTAKGLRAGQADANLSAPAAALLAAIDGRSDLDTLRRNAGGLPSWEIDAAAQELLLGGYAQPLGTPAPLLPQEAAEEDNPELLLSLDFTRVRTTQKLRQAAGIAKVRAAQRAEEERHAADIETARAVVERERAEREASEAQARLEAEARGMLVKILRPRVEGALRVKLTAALKPKIEHELRQSLATALRPQIEAGLRAQLLTVLKPRIELEMRTRFAKQIAELRARVQGGGEVARTGPAEVPEAAAPDDEAAARLLTCLGEAVFAADALGVLTRVNAAWTRLSGRSEAESTGRALADFFVEDGRRGVDEFLGAVAQGTAIRFVHEAALERGAGETAWIELRAAPLTLASGEAAGICGTLREASEAKRAAAELEDASLKLLLLVDESDAGVLIEDAAGVIGQVNPAFCTLFGVQAAPFSFEGEVVAELILEIAPRLADTDELLARMARIRAAGEDVDGDAVALRAGGTASLSYRAIAEDDVPRGHLWIFRAPPAPASTEEGK